MPLLPDVCRALIAGGVVVISACGGGGGDGGGGNEGAGPITGPAPVAAFDRIIFERQYPAGPIREFDIISTKLDGTGQATLTSLGERDSCPSVSPDGRWIAFYSYPNVDPLRLIIMRTDGSAKQQVATTISTSGCPSWSANSTRFTVSASNGTSGSITTYATNGSTVASFASSEGNAVISPDGTRVLFGGTGGSLSTARLDGTDRKTVAAFAISPAWSPDGTLVVYNCSGLCVAKADGTGQTLFRNDQTATRASFSPDGTRIAFGCGGGNSKAVCLVKPDGTGFTTLTGSAYGFAAAPAWSPDGTKLAYPCLILDLAVSTNEQMEICTIGADGTGRTNVSRDPRQDDVPGWARTAGT